MIIKKFKIFSSLNEGIGDELLPPSKFAREKPYDLIKNWKGSVAVFRNLHNKKMYLFDYGNIDREKFYPYAYLLFHWEYDDLGKSRVPEFESFDFDDSAISEFLNDNFPNLEYGEGFEDYEIGESQIILMDERLKKEITEKFGQFS